MALILIIDDDDQFRNMLRQILERDGQEVMDASNGDEGLRLYKERPADLIFTDIIMPKKEGLETIMDLKNERPDVKIVAISGGGRIGPENYLDLARSFGAFRTLTKPVEREVILETVREALEGPHHE